MTQEQFYDLQQLGLSITRYCRAMENFRAVKESRETQVEFDEMRMNAYSLGWNFDHKDVHNELTGILRKTYPSLKDINV